MGNEFVNERAIQRALIPWIAGGLCFMIALAPAIFMLSHPMPVAWLRPFCRDTWPVLGVCALAGVRPFSPGRYESYWSLLVIATTQAVFEAWCYNTGSHPALNPNQLWGILPQTDAHLYYTQACELLNGQRISGFHGARHPYPILLAAILWIAGHDFKLVTSIFTLLVALATWSVFETVRLRLGWLGAVIYLACVTFYIRIYCTGVFMTEQLGVLLSLCAVGMLIESLAREGIERIWLWCGGLFSLTQALNARPAAYMTLPFLALAAWKLFPGVRKARAKITGLSVGIVTIALALHVITYERAVGSPRNASNAWYCIYGLLNNGTWVDGMRHVSDLTKNKAAFGFLNYDQVRKDGADASYTIKEECLAEIRYHPLKLLHGWSRALQFVWRENTPFRCSYPKMASPWFTELARWLALLGFLVAVFLVAMQRALGPSFRFHQLLGWVLLAALIGMITSLPFAPPWDGETRILGATLPLFYLMPAFGVSFFCLFGSRRFGQQSPLAFIERVTKVPVGFGAALAAALCLIVNLGPWFLVNGRTDSREREHPVLQTMKNVVGETSLSSINLASLQSGYRLWLVDEAKPTWLPVISRKDFVRSLPRGSYLPLSERFKQIPPGTQLVSLPYWVLLVVDEADIRAGKFILAPEQTGRSVWPPVYFSKELQISFP